MSLEYRILWLDDKIHEFIEDDLILEVEEYIKGEGFEPNVIPVKTYIDFFNELDKSFDLILTDYHMPNMNGEEIVRRVRDTNNIQTEILFYTAKHDLKDAQKIDRISFLETKGNTEHEEAVVKKLKALIDLTIIKFQDIVAMRGMIMHETSDLDATKIEILKNYVEGKEPTDIEELKCGILDEIAGAFESKLTRIYGEWKTEPTGFKKLMKDSFVFSAEYKIQTLAKILNELSMVDFSSDYKKEIIQTRNKFAHAKLEIEKDEDGKVTRKYFKYGTDGITFDAQYCKVIRENIRKHKDNLDDLKSRIHE